jgi:BirA family biotin operon repressor/biotin-[acetyl-CoA-carboxylase] ligase
MKNGVFVLNWMKDNRFNYFRFKSSQTECMNLPPIGHSFQVFDNISSTNMYAMNAIREGLADHGCAYFALHQSEGKGQRGKSWWSAKGENIQLSIVLQTQWLAPSQRFRLSAAMALGCIDWLKTKAEGAWKIKWPNDLYWNDRKAGGILIESILHANKWPWAVAGFGININSKTFNPVLPNPISLTNITGLTYEPVEMAKELCSFLEQRWQQLKTGQWPVLLLEYNHCLFGRNSFQKLRYNNTLAQYLIREVDEAGNLVAGSLGEYRFSHGDVIWDLGSR